MAFDNVLSTLDVTCIHGTTFVSQSAALTSCDGSSNVTRDGISTNSSSSFFSDHESRQGAFGLSAAEGLRQLPLQPTIANRDRLEALQVLVRSHKIDQTMSESQLHELASHVDSRGGARPCP